MVRRKVMTFDEFITGVNVNGMIRDFKLRDLLFEYHPRMTKIVLRIDLENTPDPIAKRPFWVFKESIYVDNEKLRKPSDLCFYLSKLASQMRRTMMNWEDEIPRIQKEYGKNEDDETGDLGGPSQA